MTFGLKFVQGALRVLRRRAGEIGQPGLLAWTDAGERAVTQVSGEVSRMAHASECADLEAAKEIAAGLAELTDVRVRTQVRMHFERAGRLITRSAELDHNIGEFVRL